MKNRTISVKGSEIAILRKEREDYISLTDMVRGFEDGLVLIEKWLRNKNTIEFIGIWEQLHNPSFNSPEFEGVKSVAGLNRFTLSAKKFTLVTRLLPTLKEQSTDISRTTDAGRGWYSSNKQPVRIFIEGQP